MRPRQTEINCREKEVLKAMADANLNVTEAAILLWIARGSVIYHIQKIKRKTGLNARNFYDMVKLLKYIEEEPNEN